MIEQIPLEDRKKLEELFYRLINEEHFGYTLFGDKPISLGSYFKVTPWENLIELGQCDGVFWKKWQIWEKYHHLFPMKQYLLLEEESKNKNYEITNITIINKDNFIKTIKKHKAIFEKILKRKVDPEEMLNNIELGKISFVNSISNNDLLWGILLGYGKHNALLYNKRKNEHLRCSSIRHSNSKLEAFGDYNYSPLILGSVHFVADLHHREAQILQKKYQELRGKISAIYAKGDFLEITLSQLVSE